MSQPRKEITAGYFNRIATDYLPGHLGMRITSVADRRVEAEMPITPRLLAPNRYLHAGSVVALADTACGCATVAHLPVGAESFTTIEIKSNHLGTLREGSVTCVATAQHLGRTTQVWDAEVSDGDSGRRLALFRCTQMILWPQPGE